MKAFTFTDAALRALGPVDGESYWHEPADLWTSRAPASIRERVPRPRVHEALLGIGGQDRDTQWIFDGTAPLHSGTASAFWADGRRERMAVGVGQNELAMAAVSDGPERLKLLDAQGISAQVLYPTVAGLSGVRLASLTRDRELASECVRIYNDAAAELQAASGNRLLPQALLPADIAAATAELQRCAETLRLTGFCLSDDVRDVGLPDLGDPAWQPFWECADSFAIPVSLRAGSNLADVSRTAWGSYTPEEHMALLDTTASMSLGPTIGNFLLSGIHDKYPGVKMVIAGCGLGWIPFYLEIIQYQYDEMVEPANRRIDRPFKDYFRAHWYGSFSAEMSVVRRLQSVIPANRTLFSTRFPHPTSLSSEDDVPVNAFLGSLDEPARRSVLRDTAVTLFALSP